MTRVLDELHQYNLLFKKKRVFHSINGKPEDSPLSGTQKIPYTHHYEESLTEVAHRHHFSRASDSDFAADDHRLPSPIRTFHAKPHEEACQLPNHPGLGLHNSDSISEL